MSVTLHSSHRPIIAWTSALSVGNEAIDDDHRHLFSLANKVREGAHLTQNGNVVREVVDELLAFAQAHFAREEKLMKELRYAEQEEHVIEHRLLTYHLRNLHYRCASGPGLKNDELEIFLDRWLARHILTADLELAKTIGAGNVSMIGGAPLPSGRANRNADDQSLTA